jgi:hypothetical protein
MVKVYPYNPCKIETAYSASPHPITIIVSIQTWLFPHYSIKLILKFDNLL